MRILGLTRKDLWAALTNAVVMTALILGLVVLTGAAGATTWNIAADGAAPSEKLLPNLHQCDNSSDEDEINHVLASHFVEGDTVNFTSGVFTCDGLIDIDVSKIRFQGTGAMTNFYWPSYTAGDTGIETSVLDSNIKISNITIDHGWGHLGIHSSHTLVADVQVSHTLYARPNAADGGTKAYAFETHVYSSSTLLENVTYLRCYALDNARSGFWARCNNPNNAGAMSNISWIDCVARNSSREHIIVPASGGDTDPGWDVGFNIDQDVAWANHLLVQNCTASGSWESGFYGAETITAVTVVNATFINCTAHDNDRKDKSQTNVTVSSNWGAGFLITDNMTLIDCTATHNRFGIYLQNWGNVLIRNYTSANNTQRNAITSSVPGGGLYTLGTTAPQTSNNLTIQNYVDHNSTAALDIWGTVLLENVTSINCNNTNRCIYLRAPTGTTSDLHIDGLTVMAKNSLYPVQVYGATNVQIRNATINWTAQPSGSYGVYVSSGNSDPASIYINDSTVNGNMLMAYALYNNNAVNATSTNNTLTGWSTARVWRFTEYDAATGGGGSSPDPGYGASCIDDFSTNTTSTYYNYVEDVSDVFRWNATGGQMDANTSSVSVTDATMLNKSLYSGYGAYSACVTFVRASAAGNNAAGLIFLSQSGADTGESDKGDKYAVELRNMTTYSRVYILKVTGGASTALATADYSFPMNTPINLTVNLRGNVSDIEAYVNGTLAARANDSTYTSGYAGLESYAAGLAFYDLVHFEDMPYVAMAADDTTPSVGQTVTFTDTTPGHPHAWSWTFGDGDTSTSQNPTHAYALEGDYTVTLAVSNLWGTNTTTYTDYITVGAATATADFWGFRAGAAGNTTFDDFTSDSSAGWSGNTSSFVWNTSSETLDQVVTANNVRIFNATLHRNGTYRWQMNLTDLQDSSWSTRLFFGSLDNGGGAVSTYGNTYALGISNTSTTKGIYLFKVIGGTQSTLGSVNFYHDVRKVYNYTVQWDPDNTTTILVSNESGYLFGSADRALNTSGFAGVGITSGYAGTGVRYDAVNFTEREPGDRGYVNGSAPLTVMFRDRSVIVSPLSWNWSFGDGSYGTTQHPVHTYAAAGIYDVSLTVQNVSGFDTMTRTGYVNATVLTPSAAFSGTPTSGPVPLTVTFTDTSDLVAPLAWHWDLNGDGVTDNTSQHPFYVYSSAGTYDVSLTVYNASGHSTETKVGYITAFLGGYPTAAFSGTPTSGVSPTTVAFTDASTCFNCLSYNWSFGDGNFSALQNPTHQYSGIGTYSVTLNVTNASAFDLETKVGYITIIPNPPPEAAFSANATTGTVPCPILFTDSSRTSIIAWSWTFGDGGTSMAQNPVHTYAAAGTYTVGLTVTNASGYSDTETKAGYVTISVPASPVPVAGFTASPTSGDAPLTVVFTDTSTGLDILSWAWDFGDGDTTNATDQSPVHTYATGGTYTATLTVTNASGSDSASTVITVSQAGAWSRPTAYSTVPTLNEAPYYSLMGMFGDDEVDPAQNQSIYVPNVPGVLAVTAGVYTAPLGNIALVLIFAIPFLMMYIMGESITLPAVSGIIVGGFVLFRLPEEYHMVAVGCIILSIVAVIYSLYKSKESG